MIDRDKEEEEPISRESRKVPEFDLCDFETLIKRVTLKKGEKCEIKEVRPNGIYNISLSLITLPTSSSMSFKVRMASLHCSTPSAYRLSASSAAARRPATARIT